MRGSAGIFVVHIRAWQAATGAGRRAPATTARLDRDCSSRAACTVSAAGRRTASISRSSAAAPGLYPCSAAAADRHQRESGSVTLRTGLGFSSLPGPARPARLSPRARGGAASARASRSAAGPPGGTRDRDRLAGRRLPAARLRSHHRPAPAAGRLVLQGDPRRLTATAAAAWSAAARRPARPARPAPRRRAPPRPPRAANRRHAARASATAGGHPAEPAAEQVLTGPPRRLTAGRRPRSGGSCAAGPVGRPDASRRS